MKIFKKKEKKTPKLSCPFCGAGDGQTHVPPCTIPGKFRRM